MDSLLSRYTCYPQVQPIFRYLHGDMIKSRSHVPGYTGNPSRFPLSSDTINSLLTSLFTAFVLRRVIFYILYLILKLYMNDKLQTCLIFYSKKKSISKNIVLESLRKLNFSYNRYMILLILLYCICNLFSSGKKSRSSSLSQRYSWVVSLFSIVILWCA